MKPCSAPCASHCPPHIGHRMHSRYRGCRRRRASRRAAQAGKPERIRTCHQGIRIPQTSHRRLTLLVSPQTTPRVLHRHCIRSPDVNKTDLIRANLKQPNIITLHCAMHNGALRHKYFMSAFSNKCIRSLLSSQQKF